MAFKQPRVPEYLESEGTGKYLRSLVLFLKDFCMDVWTANKQRSGEIDDVRKGAASDSSKLDGKTWAQVLEAIYPVGSVYMSFDPTSPASLFGGTWEQIKDRFLLAAGSTYAASSTGGEAEHAHTLASAYACISVSDYSLHYSYSNNPQASFTPGWKGVFNITESDTIEQNCPADIGGQTDEESNMPPYLAVYMWKRVS